MEQSRIRLDKFLWSIRIFKTRAAAAEACEKNKVKFNDKPAKASKSVNIGDEYEIKTETRKWVIKVTGLLANRVQFSEAVKCYLDLTPEQTDTYNFQPSAFHTGKRLSKIGRPTKKQKREIDNFNKSSGENFSE